MRSTSSVDEQIKLDDAGSYDPLAETFDRFTTFCSTSLAVSAVDLAGVERGGRFLDVGTGTGLVALEAVRRMGPKGKVVGIDLSEGMLVVARAKASVAGLTNRVEFRRMDAEALKLEDRSFDVVVSLFALFHLPNPLTALQEMYRVLRPGGRVVIGVGSRPGLSSWSGFVHHLEGLPRLWAALRGLRLTAPGFLNGLLEKHFPSLSPAEVPEWVTKTWGIKRRVRGLMREAGFTNLHSSWAGHQASFGSPEDFWDLQVTFSSMARKRLSRTSGQKRDALHSEFLQRCAQVRSRGGKLVFPVGAYYVVGEKMTNEQ
jgi:ubiquinone/menaquinone biosynthesis C-methylase UbiE